jgi:8-oxo-dGTP pyrophosphatase MutT (NUDIX family)
MKHWRTQIEELLKNCLPGESSHRKMLPPERDLNMPAENMQVLHSGVLLLLFPDGNDLYTCLIKRSALMKIHAGQIGFPGGRHEQKDASPRETALRETTEEIGLPAEEVTVLGSLTPLYVSVSNYMIYPFVAWTAQKPVFEVNCHEVEELLFFPLRSHIKNPTVTFTEVQTISGILKVPGIPFQGKFIWGATAMILTEFLDILSQADLTRE